MRSFVTIVERPLKFINRLRRRRVPIVNRNSTPFGIIQSITSVVTSTKITQYRREIRGIFPTPLINNGGGAEEQNGRLVSTGMKFNLAQVVKAPRIMRKQNNAQTLMSRVPDVRLSDVDIVNDKIDCGCNHPQ